MSNLLPPGYCLLTGSTLDRSLLVKFLQRTYRELFPTGEVDHLALTVEQYFSKETPLWWVEWTDPDAPPLDGMPSARSIHPIAGLWLGNAIDQVNGDRHAHIFCSTSPPTIGAEASDRR